MLRKKLIAVSSFLIMLSFASVTYANSCPGSEGCPINATTLTGLKAIGVPNSEILMASQYLKGYGENIAK